MAVLPQEYLERFKSIGGEEAEGNSKGARLEIMKDAVVIFTNNPMGVGVASFPAVRMATFGRYQDTHNLYLEVATNLGVQGLMVFLGFVGVMMVSFRRTMMVFRDQIGLVRRMVVVGKPTGKLRELLAQQAADLEFLIATAKAAAGFIVVRLVLGAFGMDLYEVYWWFGAGLAHCPGGNRLPFQTVY